MSAARRGARWSLIAALALATLAAGCRDARAPAAPSSVSSEPVSLLDHVPADSAAVLVLDGTDPEGRAILAGLAPIGGAFIDGIGAILDRKPSTGKPLPRRILESIGARLARMTPAERERAGIGGAVQGIGYLWHLTPVVRLRGDGDYLLAELLAATKADALEIAVATRGRYRVVQLPLIRGTMVIAFAPDEIAAAVTAQPDRLVAHLVGDDEPAHAMTRAHLDERAGPGARPVVVVDPAALGRAFVEPDADRFLLDKIVGEPCRAGLAQALATAAPVAVARAGGDWMFAIGPTAEVAGWLRREVREIPRWPAPSADTIVLGTGLSPVAAMRAVAPRTDVLDGQLAPCGLGPMGFGDDLRADPAIVAAFEQLQGATAVLRGTDVDHLEIAVVLGLRDPIAFWRWASAQLGTPPGNPTIGGAIAIPGPGPAAYVVFAKDALALSINGFDEASLRALLAAPPGPRTAFAGRLDADVAAAGFAWAQNANAWLADTLGNHAVSVETEGDRVRLRVESQQP